MTLVAPCLEPRPQPLLDATPRHYRHDIAREVHFDGGGVLSEVAGRLRLRSAGQPARLLPGRLTVEPGGIAVSFGPWVQQVSVSTGHHLSQVCADFARGVAYRLTVTAQQSVIEATEQYFDGIRFRRAHPIRWSRDGATLVLRSALGELILTPPVPLDWALKSPVVALT
jgi:hypothetical protein